MANIVNEKNYLGIDWQPEPGQEKVVVLPVPYEASVSYLEGTGDGPQALIRASGYVEEVEEHSQIDLRHYNIRTLRELPVRDSSPEEMVAAVKKEATSWIKQGKWVLALGGEHTISVGAAGAACEAFDGLGILHLDAHHDLRLEYWGSKYSHACVIRRLHELYKVPVVSVGIRAFCPEEKEFARDNGIATCYGWECAGKIEAVYPLLDKLPKRIYVTLDVDVLDPSIMPATGTPEPQGLSYAEVCAVISHVAKGRHIVGADIVELSPREVFHYAEYTAAKLANWLMINSLSPQS